MKIRGLEINLSTIWKIFIKRSPWIFMKWTLMKIGLFLLLLSFNSQAYALSKTLEESFQAALQQSELVASQAELIVQAEERYRQAIGSILPAIVGTGTYLYQPAPATTFFPSTQPLVRITATQPLFQGFREFAGLRQTKHLVTVQDQTRWQAMLQLYMDTATNFYSILSYEVDLLDIQKELTLYDRRISELNQYVKIGRSQESEVLTARTQRETLAAQAEQDKIQIRALREVYHFYTGFQQDTVLLDDEKVPDTVPPLLKYLSEVVNRPDVKSAEANVLAAEENVKVAFGQHLPTVNLSGNYYFLRYGPQAGVIDWDTTLNVSLPIFSGGVIQSNVRIARSQKEQNVLALSRARRLAEQYVGTYYNNLQGDLGLVAKYRDVTQLAEKTYQFQLRDYKHGLVKNIDVLQALVTFQDNQRNLDRSRFSLKLDFANMEASVARRPRSAWIQ